LRYFPLARGKTRIFSALWKPLSFGEYYRETTLLQADIKLSCDLTKFLQRYLYFFGSYEKEYCDYWMKLAPHAVIIFDIGANVGLYSLLAAAVNPASRIHAFEPTPEIGEAFRENIRRNRLKNIFVSSLGVGNGSGQAFLQRFMGGEDIYDGMNFISAQKTESANLPISVIAIADYCRQNGLARIDLMKMDIEGGEYDALLGAKNLLESQAIGCIFLELVESHARRFDHSTVEIKRLLANAGYQISTLHSGKLVSVPIEKVHNGQGDNVIAFAPDFKKTISLKHKTAF
jgi:FkbM family methyltransferase